MQKYNASAVESEAPILVGLNVHESLKIGCVVVALRDLTRGG